MNKIFTTALSAFFACPALADEVPAATIQIQSKSAHNACTPKGLRIMKSKLLALRIESPAEAWRAIETIICGQAGRRDLRYLALIALPEVEVSHESSNEEKPGILKASLLQPHHVFAQKIAYNVDFSKYGDVLEINYEPSEVCVARRTLRYRANKWRLSEVMYGCE